MGKDVNFVNERYMLNWAGKSEAFKALQVPTTKTLVPDKKEYDNKRNEYLKILGIKIIHIPDIDIKKNLNGVMNMLFSRPDLYRATRSSGER